MTLLTTVLNYIFTFRGKEALVKRFQANDLATTVASAAVSFQTQGVLEEKEYLELFIFLANDPNYETILSHLLELYPGMVWTEIPGEPVS